MPTFLHIGCGPKRKDQTTRGFNTDDWTELRFDIDELNRNNSRIIGDRPRFMVCFRCSEY